MCVVIFEGEAEKPPASTPSSGTTRSTTPTSPFPTKGARLRTRRARTILTPTLRLRRGRATPAGRCPRWKCPPRRRRRTTAPTIPTASSGGTRGDTTARAAADTSHGTRPVRQRARITPSDLSPPRTPSSPLTSDRRRCKCQRRCKFPKRPPTFPPPTWESTSARIRSQVWRERRTLIPTRYSCPDQPPQVRYSSAPLLRPAV